MAFYFSGMVLCYVLQEKVKRKSQFVLCTPFLLSKLSNLSVFNSPYTSFSPVIYVACLWTSSISVCMAIVSVILFFIVIHSVLPTS